MYMGVVAPEAVGELGVDKVNLLRRPALCVGTAATGATKEDGRATADTEVNWVRKLAVDGFLEAAGLADMWE